MTHSSQLSVQDVQKMLLSELKNELKERGVSTVGKKADLMKRLLDWLVDNPLTYAPVDAENDGGGDGMEADQPVEAFDLKDGSIAIATDEEKDPKNNNTKDEAIGNTMSNESNDSHSCEEISKATDADRRKTALKEKLSRMKSLGAPSASTIGEKSTITVRIDHFQRPLNAIGLHEWLVSICECRIPEKSIWINSIKTHCYIDFLSHEDASKCIDKVTGKKYPNSNTKTLVCTFTSVTAKEAAAGAPEAQLKPGEWQRPTEEANSVSVSTGRIVNTINENESSEGAVDTLSGNKRKQNGDESRRALNMGGIGGLFKRATADTLFGRSGVTAETQEVRASSNAGSSSGGVGGVRRSIKILHGGSEHNQSSQLLSRENSIANTKTDETERFSKKSRLPTEKWTKLTAQEKELMLDNEFGKRPSRSEQEIRTALRNKKKESVINSFQDPMKHTRVLPVLLWCCAPQEDIEKRLRNMNSS